MSRDPENPYEPPATASSTNGGRSSALKTVTKWGVALTGGLIVALGAFLAIMLVPTLLFPAVYTSMTGLAAMYVVGIVGSLAAGAASLRATLRHYDRQP
jgi:hypothetical protein